MPRPRQSRRGLRGRRIHYALRLARCKLSRLPDGEHRQHNEMHRHTRREGKQAGAPFHSGTLGEGMRAAIQEIEGGYREMVEGWESQ